MIGLTLAGRYHPGSVIPTLTMTPFNILGLHHVTATVDEAQPDLDFCLDVLALRLVKKTVNFDNHHVYHFYYGDERGTPGTIWTTFPYHGRGVPAGQHGAGQVTATAFSVPSSSLEFWTSSFDGSGVPHTSLSECFGEQRLRVRDSSGLVFDVVAADDSRPPWTGGRVPADSAIRGLHSVTLTVRDPEPTIEFMRSLLGFDVKAEEQGRLRTSVGDGAAGRIIDVEYDTHAEAARNGLGTVHHVAMAVGTAEEQRALRDELVRRDIKVTPVLDRQYFQSIYFREPGGVLFEVATLQPGFLVDEDLAELGRSLKLPPWEEPHRSEITRGLAPVRHK
jgi:glyoxalase family protein